MPSSEEPAVVPPPIETLPPSRSSRGFLTRQARRVVAGVVGVTVLGLGAALLVLPGPGIPFVVLGLSILAAEFAWARRLLRRVQRGGRRVLPQRLRRLLFRR